MESQKERIKKLVELTSSEKRGILFFLFLIILILYIPEIHSHYFKERVEKTVYEKQLTELSLEGDSPEKYQVEVEPLMHPFDPNLSSVQELNSLGLPEYLSNRIDLYRKSGGRFKTKEDLLKIYGMDEQLYTRLKPFISIEEKRKELRVNRIDKKPFVKTSVFLDVNASDSADLVGIRGIGPTYASRIIKYRAALGGFYKLEQVKEVYGINDSLYWAIKGYIYIDTISANKKISINHIGMQELRIHPYFRSYNLCNALIKYRDQHGHFKSAVELKKIHLMNDSVLEKIAPYLSFE